ncbi:methyl-accepting chemotaxis protein [Cohnella terricola]|uniref:Methyl-accepting chemotaxis protein n=1 Tax=Cohnella terricola TaxID=1289167 RepID=A0A559J4U2_9BACL|nr:methyl-accepting chemotaxis protein [Cohnella terricola]TVX94918.1 hypothetical protein FPZ45_24430 [Cohnella terricola]
MLNNISIRTKLLILLFAPLVLFATTAVYLLQLNSSNVGKLTKALYETSYRSISLVLNADRDMYQAFAAYQEMQSQYVSAEDKQKAKADFHENVQQTIDRMEQTSRIIMDKGISDEPDPSSGMTIGTAISEVDRLFKIWVDEAQAHFENNDYSIESETELKQHFEEARANINIIGEILENYSEQEARDAKAEASKTSTITYAVLIGEWILLTLFGVMIIRKLSWTVSLVRSKTRQVAEGNLEYEPQAKYDKDELGQILFSIDSMIGKMRELIGSIAGHARQVSTSSGELAESARESAAASGHVAENVQLVTSLAETQSSIARESNVAMEEMAIGVQKIVESMNVISDHSSTTSGMADESMATLEKLLDQMNRMVSTVADLSRSVNALSDKSDRIGSITEKITSIANQTSILSLNASIESARAGEHGKGFAVVAQEIRKLSAISLESAQAIQELLDDTRSEIGQASEFMKSTVDSSELSAAALTEVNHGFEEIVGSIRQIARQLHDTSAVTEQMSASTEEVSAGQETAATSAIDISAKAQNISAATEEQLALSENIASASEQLQQIVGKLNEAVRYFKL